MSGDVENIKDTTDPFQGEENLAPPTGYATVVERRFDGSFISGAGDDIFYFNDSFVYGVGDVEGDDFYVIGQYQIGNINLNDVTGDNRVYFDDNFVINYARISGQGLILGYDNGDGGYSELRVRDANTRYKFYLGNNDTDLTVTQLIAQVGVTHAPVGIPTKTLTANGVFEVDDTLITASTDFGVTLLGGIGLDVFTLGFSQNGTLNGRAGADYYNLTRFQESASLNLRDTEGSNHFIVEAGVAIADVSKSGEAIILDLANGGEIRIAGGLTNYMFHIGDLNEGTITGGQFLTDYGTSGLTVFLSNTLTIADADSNNRISGSDRVIDILDASATSSTNTVNLIHGTAKIDGMDYTLESIENYIGGSGADTITGTDGDNELTGGMGADTFIISGGSDMITDFETSEDKILLAYGTTYNISADSQTITVHDASNTDTIHGRVELTTGSVVAGDIDIGLPTFGNHDTNPAAFDENQGGSDTLNIDLMAAGEGLTFSISEIVGSRVNFFSTTANDFDITNGTLTLKDAGLNREAIATADPTGTLTIGITAENSFGTTATSVTLLVNDLNDETPYVRQIHLGERGGTTGYEFSVKEGGIIRDNTPASLLVEIADDDFRYSTRPGGFLNGSDAGKELIIIFGEDSDYFRTEIYNGNHYIILNSILRPREIPVGGKIVDFDVKSTYFLEFIVRDLAGHISDINTVTINVTEVDDSVVIPIFIDATVFENVANTASVAENSAASFFTINVDNTYTLSLESTNVAPDNGFFRLGGVNTIAPIAPLDFEERQSYTIVVLADEGGPTSPITPHTIVVSVTDVDEEPVIIEGESSYRGSIALNTIGTIAALEEGHSTFRLVAEDPEGASLTYTLSAEDIAEGFRIDADTGIVTLSEAKTLAVESLLTVTISDATNNSIDQFIRVKVGDVPTVLEFDNPLVFLAIDSAANSHISGAEYSVPLEITAEVENAGLRLPAYSDDLEDAFLLVSKGANTFTVTMQDVELENGLFIGFADLTTIEDSLTDGDRYDFAVRLQGVHGGGNVDAPYITQGAFPDVQININRPVLFADDLQATFTENTNEPLKDLSLNLNAMTHDGAPSDFTYQVVEVIGSRLNDNSFPIIAPIAFTVTEVGQFRLSGNFGSASYGGIFDPNPSDPNSELTALIRLDREDTIDSSLTVLVTATDEDANVGTASITLTIGDVDDSPAVLVSDRVADIPLQRNNSVAYSFQVSDLDTGNAGKDDFSFSIMSATNHLGADTSDLFTIGANSGEISLANFTPDREYTLTIEAKELDTESDTDTTLHTITLNIGDQGVPPFVGSPPMFAGTLPATAYIYENYSFAVRSGSEEMIGSRVETTLGDVVNFLATDADGDPISYSLDRDSSALFTIDNTTGHIHSRDGAVDFEEAATHTLTIFASDGARTDSFELELKVINKLPQIEILQENEGIFEISSDRTFTLSETANLGQIDNYYLRVGDTDGVDINYIFLSLGDHFSIGSNGELELTRAINLEEISMLEEDFNLTRTVTVETINNGQIPDSTVQIEVIIINVDDEAAVLTSDKNTGLTVDIGSSPQISYKVEVSDPDLVSSGDSEEFTFELIDVMNENISQKDDFSIATNTGIITYVGDDLESSDIGTYTFTVRSTEEDSDTTADHEITLTLYPSERDLFFAGGGTTITAAADGTITIAEAMSLTIEIPAVIKTRGKQETVPITAEDLASITFQIRNINGTAGNITLTDFSVANGTITATADLGDFADGVIINEEQHFLRFRLDSSNPEIITSSPLQGYSETIIIENVTTIIPPNFAMDRDDPPAFDENTNSLSYDLEATGDSLTYAVVNIIGLRTGNNNITADDFMISDDGILTLDADGLDRDAIVGDTNAGAITIVVSATNISGSAKTSVTMQVNDMDDEDAVIEKSSGRLLTTTENGATIFTFNISDIDIVSSGMADDFTFANFMASANSGNDDVSSDFELIADMQDKSMGFIRYTGSNSLVLGTDYRFTFESTETDSTLQATHTLNIDVTAPTAPMADSAGDYADVADTKVKHTYGTAFEPIALLDRERSITGASDKFDILDYNDTLPYPAVVNLSSTTYSLNSTFEGFEIPQLITFPTNYPHIKPNISSIFLGSIFIGTVTLSDFEGAIGGSKSDIIIGSNGENKLTGARAIDALYGLGGNDILDGGGGADWLYGGDGHDTIMAGRGHDIVIAGNGNDRVVGIQGRENIVAGNGNDTLIGGALDDTFFLTKGNDTIWIGDENSAASTTGDQIFIFAEDDSTFLGTKTINGYSGNLIMMVTDDVATGAWVEDGTDRIYRIGSNDIVRLVQGQHSNAFGTLSEGTLQTMQVDTALAILNPAGGALSPFVTFATDDVIDFTSRDDGKWILNNHASDRNFTLDSPFRLVWQDADATTIVDTRQDLQYGFENEKFDVRIANGNLEIHFADDNKITIDRAEDFADSYISDVDNFLMALGIDNFGF